MYGRCRKAATNSACFGPLWSRCSRRSAADRYRSTTPYGKAIFKTGGRGSAQRAFCSSRWFGQPDRLRGRPVRSSLSGFDLETLGIPRATKPRVGFGLGLLHRLLVVRDALASKSLKLGVFLRAADVHASALIRVGVKVHGIPSRISRNDLLRRQAGDIELLFGIGGHVRNEAGRFQQSGGVVGCFAL